MNDPHPGELNELDKVQDERLSELYRTARNAEPPDWLDQRILTAARTAVKPRPTPAISWLWPRVSRFWAAPVALAATVVLAVGLWRGLPPTSELGGTPAPMEEKAAPSLARPAAELNAARARSADTVVAPPTVPSPTLPSSAKPDEQRLIRPRAMPEPARSESFQAAPARRPADEEATSLHQPADRRSPSAWRAEIAELRRQGRTAEAEARLAEFRRQYPHESLNEAEPR